MSRATDAEMKRKLTDQALRITIAESTASSLRQELADARVRAARAEGELAAVKETVASLLAAHRWAELESAKRLLEVKVADLERELRQHERELRQEWTQALATKQIPQPERKKQ